MIWFLFLLRNYYILPPHQTKCFQRQRLYQVPSRRLWERSDSVLFLLVVVMYCSLHNSLSIGCGIVFLHVLTDICCVYVCWATMVPINIDFDGDSIGY